MKIILLALFAAVGLGGCAVYPAYSTYGYDAYGPGYYLEPAPPSVYIYGSGVYGGSGAYRDYRGPRYGDGWRGRDHDGIRNRGDWDRDSDGVPNRFDRRPNSPGRR
ncbi:MAG: hypothetical protein ABI343_00345 [Burkholderiaceae bacterium]